MNSAPEKHSLESSRLELHHSILQTAMDGFWLADQQGRILEVNEAYCRMSGYKAQELLAMHIADLDAEETAAETDSHVRKVITQGEDRFESRHRRKDGSTFDVEVSVQYRPIEGGRMVVFLRDITERKRAEEALRKSEATLSEVIRSVPQSIFWKDRHSVYVGCNDVFARTAGLSDPMSIVGKSDFELPWLREEAEAYRADDQTVMESGQPKRHYVESLHQADGTSLWIDVTKVPLREADGQVNGVLGVFEDITERKQTEAALRKSEAQFAAAFDLNPLAANLVTLAEGRIIAVNERYCQFFGYAREDIIGRTVSELSMWEEPTSRDTLMQRVRREGSVRDYEARLRRKDGTVRDVLISVTVIDYLDASEPVVLSMLTDVTGKKAMEAQLLQNQRMEVIGSLAGGIAHDLNNILAPIMLVGDLLQGRLQNPEDQETLEMAMSGARRGADIIKQLLTFSRGQQGERVAVQVRYLILEMLKIMRETFPRDIDLKQHVPLNSWTVIADSTQLHQVLLNLCVNARDAMPTGGRLTIAATNASLAAGDVVLPSDRKPGPYVVLEVSDTGHGIPPEIQRRIFDPFFTTKPLGEGTGLGLSTVLGIVLNHGGFIRLNSTPGKGSSFKVFLPALPAGVEAKVEIPPDSPVVHRCGQTILVVDDERSIRETSRILLEHHRFQVLTAVHGEDAITQFLQHREKIKLVLTDVMMPVMNGVTLVRALRAIDPELKIIASSGLGDAAHGKELTALGVLEMLMKPYAGTELIAAVHRHLSDP